MVAFIAALLGGLVSAAASMVGRVLIALGVGYVTYSGLDAGFDSLKLSVFSQLSGLPADILAFVAIAKFDVAINILFSAIAARLVLSGLTSGAITRMVLK